MAKKMKIEEETTMQSAKKMKIEEETTMQSARYVSYDIILEILYRLSRKSLLRFTSVSKSWKASIRSPNFISAHHQINKDISCSHLLHMQHSSPKYCTLVPESSDKVKSETPFPPLKSPSVQIVGSSEGLVCLRTRSAVYLWNPFISSMKRINSVRQFPELSLGFGFAPQSRDYKIVKPSVEGGYLTGVEMYSVSSDSWTRMKSPSGRLERSKIYNLGSKVCFKGSIYWKINLYTVSMNSPVIMILRIDLEEQKMEEIETNRSEINLNLRTSITVVNGFLVLLNVLVLLNDIRGIRIQSYIYKESKSKSGSSSWTALKIVDLPIGKADTMGPMTKSGHVILQRSPGGRLLACDGYYDGKDLNFKLRDLGISTDTLWRFGFITSIKDTLHLLDEGKGKHLRKRNGRQRYFLWSVDM